MNKLMEIIGELHLHGHRNTGKFYGDDGQVKDTEEFKELLKSMEMWSSINFTENELLVLRKSLRIRIWDLEKWRMQLAESGLDVSSVNLEIDSLEAIFEKLGG